MKIAIVGAGVAGLCCATELRKHNLHVTIYERGSAVGERACSWFAGGMLAPWCERENADEAVLLHGQLALQWWREHSTAVSQMGTLVVASARDRVDLKRFSQRTDGYQWLNAQGVSTLEPDLGDRFQQALYFPDEAHLNPRLAIQELAVNLQHNGVPIHFDSEVEVDELDADVVIDCRGFNAKAQWPELRGVKGEMLILRSDELQLNRPVRLLHPRIPLYVVPREGGHFMVGATMLEQSDRQAISARSLLELLGSAYALHPAFGEAEVVEIGVDVRPAFQDNLPRVERHGRVIRANGLYRHGFLLGPALAKRAAEMVINPKIESGVFSCN